VKIIIGNQKTYLNTNEINDFIENTNDRNDVIICPSYPYISKYLENSKYIVGAQNVSEKTNGGTTGEVSASQLKSLGASYCIVGHSERRQMFNEKSENIVNKITRLFEEGITVIFCVGENLELREAGTTKDYVGKQILEVFDNIDRTKLEDVIIAYEPIWAIGTGLTPTNDEIADVISYIKDLVKDKYDKDIKVLYGGSVSMKNIDELNTIDIVDGYLIGGASTKPEEFNYIMDRNV
jgi:triosephosphate isomerase